MGLFLRRTGSGRGQLRNLFEWKLDLGILWWWRTGRYQLCDDGVELDADHVESANR